ncbi:hypothetical protein K501DRAFT_324126 [Backusella circina FSU 941]|nr:hypothetical protein K501DRAFT_324126 [Backusella circina FSU 941]
MTFFYTVKFDNVLKRVEEPQSVGRDEAALQALHDVVMSKRSRINSIAVMEPVMLKYIKLCVEIRMGEMAKKGLYQYRNMAQNTDASSIETIIDKLLGFAHEKVENTQSIMLSTVSGDQIRDRTVLDVVTLWLKFLWKSYRTVLEIMGNNNRLESLYYSLTLKAFQFCFTYNCRTEFRRLCDLLRNHFLNVAKCTHQPHAINLNNPETFQHFLDSRFVQLNAVTELELWIEVFRSVEDIHTLLVMSKTPPKPIMMAIYYEKLIKIFVVSDNYFFHSATWNRYSSFKCSENKNLSEINQAHMDSMVLLSALAIPIITTPKIRPGDIETNEYHISKLNRLSMLMGLPSHPTRTSLLKEALMKNTLSCVHPEIRDIYDILEVRFHPFSICKKIDPIIVKLLKSPDLSKYVHPLQEVILTGLLQRLSQVYATVKLDFVLNLASFSAPFRYDAVVIEKLIINGCKRGKLNIRIDHASKSLMFENNLLALSKDTVAEGIQLQSSPAELIRTQISRLGTSLYGVVQMMDPSIKEAAQRALKEAEEEHRIMIAQIMKLKWHDKKTAKKAEDEKESVKLELRRHEMQRDQAKFLAEDIKNRAGHQLKPEEIDKSSVEILLNLKRTILQTQQQELIELLKQVSKQEISLLEKDYENQLKRNKAFHKASLKAYLINIKARFDEDMKLKKRLSRLSDDWSTFKAEIQERHRQATDALHREAGQAIEQEKQERIALWHQEIDLIIKACDAEQAEITLREKEEHKREEKERRVREEIEAPEKQRYTIKQINHGVVIILEDSVVIITTWDQVTGKEVTIIAIIMIARVVIVIVIALIIMMMMMMKNEPLLVKGGIKKGLVVALVVMNGAKLVTEIWIEVTVVPIFLVVLAGPQELVKMKYFGKLFRYSKWRKSL